MRVACVANGWFPEMPGGLNRYSHGLATNLAQSGHAIDFFCTGHPEVYLQNFQAYSLGDSSASLLQRMRQARNCFKRHWPNSPDVVNLHFALSALPALRFLPPSMPVVCNFQGPWAAESKLEGDGTISTVIKYWIERRVYGRSNRFIVLSNAFKRILHESYGVPNQLVDVIRCGIDTSRFSPNSSPAAARRHLGWPNDRFVLFTVRRLVNRVGLIELIRAIDILRRNGSEPWLAIAGTGPLAAKLTAIIEELNLQSHVRMLGAVSDEDLVTAYQAANLTVVPSQGLEGLGYIIPESLACGTPVMATPVGGMPEVIEPLKPDLIIPGVDQETIARSILGVILGELTLPEPQQCRNYAVEHFSWPLIARKVQQVFENAQL